MTDALSALLDQPPWLILTISALVVFGECALLVGMVLGGLERTGPVVWGMPHAANLTIRQLGLLFFQVALRLQ